MSAAPRITNAFVLAAGMGTRMRPLTNTMPKPLVRLAGRPLLDHVLDRLQEAGCSRAVVNVHHFADQIEKHLAARTSPRITISDERDTLLDTGGGAVRALPKLGDDPFIIHNSDSVWIEGMGGNIGRLVAAWDDNTMDALLLLAPSATSIGYDGVGDFSMDADGRLLRQSGARVAPFVFAGVSITSPRLFANAPSGPFSLNVLWNRAIEKQRLFGLRLEGIWMHVGTPAAITEAEQAIANSNLTGAPSDASA